MSFLRMVYRWLYVHVKGHLPTGTLVRFYWKSPGGTMINAVGLVIGMWSKYKHPIPGILVTGSVVLFDAARYDMDNWELEAIDESR
jgi:hypothetical protein